MSGIIMKEAKRKIKHPTDDPMFEKRKAVAEKNIREGKLKFESEADERDYKRRINANPNNVYGNPAFFPAQTLTFARFAYDKRDCPNCGKTIYDELECMYCGEDLKNVQPYK